MSTQYWVSVAERVAYNTSDYQTGVPALICMYLCLWCIISYFRDTRFPSLMTLFLNHSWKGKKNSTFKWKFCDAGLSLSIYCFQTLKTFRQYSSFLTVTMTFNILKCSMLTKVDIYTICTYISGWWCSQDCLLFYSLCMRTPSLGHKLVPNRPRHPSKAHVHTYAPPPPLSVRARVAKSPLLSLNSLPHPKHRGDVTIAVTVGGTFNWD